MLIDERDCLVVNLNAQSAPLERIPDSQYHPIKMDDLLFQRLDLLLLCLRLRGQGADGLLLHLAESFSAIASIHHHGSDERAKRDNAAHNRKKCTQFRWHDDLSRGRPSVPRWLPLP